MQCTSITRQVRESIGQDASGHFNLTLNKKTGPDTVLPREVELELAEYIKYRHSIHSPVSKSKVAVDLQKYIRQEKLIVKFMTEDKPGWAVIS